MSPVVATAAPGSAAPRKPCSGVKSATRFTPAARSRSTSDTPRRSTPVWFVSRPTRVPAPGAGCPPAARRSPGAPLFAPIGPPAPPSTPGPRTRASAQHTQQQDMRPVHEAPALVMVLLCACGGSAVAPPTPQPEPFRRSAPGADRGRPLARMSPREKIAQLVVPWIAGTYMADDDPTFMKIVGRLAPGRRPDRVDRLAARHRSQAEHACRRHAAAAAHRLRPRGRHRTPSHRRDRRFPSNMGVGATGRDQDGV